MNDKQARFVAEYLIDLNATEAAKRCGYSPKTAHVQGSRLLTNAEVAAAVAEGQAKRLQTAELSAVRVLEEMRRLAFFDVADIFDTDGTLRPIHEIPKEARAAIAGIEVARANFDKTDGKKSDEWLHKVKLASKDRALEMLGKHFGLLEEKHSLSGTFVIKWEDDK